MNNQELIELSPAECEARITEIEHAMHKMFKGVMADTKREQLQLVIDRERALADKQRSPRE
ncbi:hypothetical protein [Limnohabitans sp. Rim8]|uniref:hypothetical protein n=1 Tax=Limnohabitans sp. Rim8 TaxID=1100718 RepID=UPI0033063C73